MDRQQVIVTNNLIFHCTFSPTRLWYYYFLIFFSYIYIHVFQMKIHSKRRWSHTKNIPSRRDFDLTGVCVRSVPTPRFEYKPKVNRSDTAVLSIIYCLWTEPKSPKRISPLIVAAAGRAIIYCSRVRAADVSPTSPSEYPTPRRSVS